MPRNEGVRGSSPRVGSQSPTGDRVAASCTVPAVTIWRVRSSDRPGALGAIGYTSSDWAELTQPLRVVTCGGSHPRFAEVSARLHEVVPDVSAATFPSLSHLESPQRHHPDSLGALLVELWSRARIERDST
jgi:hypothetical protein